MISPCVCAALFPRRNERRRGKSRLRRGDEQRSGSGSSRRWRLRWRSGRSAAVVPLRFAPCSALLLSYAALPMAGAEERTGGWRLEEFCGRAARGKQKGRKEKCRWLFVRRLAAGVCEWRWMMGQ